MIIYISGPMTGLPNLNFDSFMALEAKLLGEGHDVLNPARFGDGGTWVECLKRDIRLLMEAEALVLMHGWENSRGAKLEYDVAMALGYRIGYYDQHTGQVCWFAEATVTDNSRPDELDEPDYVGEAEFGDPDDGPWCPFSFGG